MASGTWKKYQNLWLSGQLKLRKGASIDRDDQVVSIDSATATITHEQHGNGRVISFDRAAGIAATIPGANGSGKKLTIVVNTTLTGSGVLTCPSGSDFVGLAIISGTADFIGVHVAGNNTLTMNGTTTGGLEGSKVDLVDSSPGQWSVVYHGNGSGTTVTPFSTV